MLQIGHSAPWPSSAVHDTVATIARQAAYTRTLGQSLAERLLNWVMRLIAELVSFFRGSGNGRTVTLVLLAALVLLLIARFLVVMRAAQEEQGPARAGGRRDRARDAWADAERMSAAGRYTEAAHALFQALLATFAARGEVRLHASKTAGDYARELSRGSSSAALPFRLFRLRYDNVIYGAGSCDAQDYSVLLQHARPMIERVTSA